MRHENGVTSGRVKFGLAFEGPPGNVHGGFVAHFFDQVLGHHNVAAKIPAMTGTLSAQGEPIAEAEGLFVLPRQPFDGYAQRPPRDQEPSGQTGADHE